MKVLLLIAFSILSFSAFSQKLELTDCKKANLGIESLLPGSENQRSFYKGQVSLFAYDIIEPAAASQGIAIAYIEPEEYPEGFVNRQCVAVTYLSGVDLKAAKSTYSAKTGVTLKVPVRNYNHETGGTTPGEIEINIKTVNLGKMSEGHVISAKKIR